jgi:hypothetical protein
MIFSYKSIPIIVFFSSLAFLVNAQETKAPPSAEELAKKLANPVASLISVPFQDNLDVGIGNFNGYRNTLNFQPVIPISLNQKTNLITRIIIPIISQQNIVADGSKQNGLGDALLSGFFSPAQSNNGFTWGAGPVALLPIATNDYLASKKWGLGPTALALKQTNGWTIGVLVNQVWSVAGDKARSDINQMFVQQFTVYNWKSGAGVGLNTEWTQSWAANTTTVFMTPQFSGVTKFGTQMIQLLIGPHLQLSGPNYSKANFGVRAQIVFVFPK